MSGHDVMRWRACWERPRQARAHAHAQRAYASSPSLSPAPHLALFNQWHGIDDIDRTSHAVDTSD
eukprot:scaffold34988_cov112-Isochrysis_galbana.AAC.2